MFTQVGCFASNGTHVSAPSTTEPSAPEVSAESSVAPAPEAPRPDPVTSGDGRFLVDLFMFDRTVGIGLIAYPCLCRADEMSSVGVFATTDGGKNVVKLADDGWPYRQVSRIRFSDRQNGYAFGSDLYVTHDGGRTWSPRKPLGAVASLVATSTRVWALTEGCPAGGSCGGPQVVISDDHGDDWRATTQPFMFDSSSFGGSIAAVSGTTAYAVVTYHTDQEPSLSAMAVTHDGGNSWRSLAVPCDPPFEPGLIAAPQGGRVLWLVCHEDPGLNHDTVRILRSFDGGATWRAGALKDRGFDGLPASFSASCCASDLATFDATSAWIASGNSAVVQTRDGGDTWTDSLQAAYGDGHRVLFVEPGVGFAFADKKIWATEDGGAHWEPRYSAGPP